MLPVPLQLFARPGSPLSQGPLPYPFSLPVQPRLLPLVLTSFLQALLLDLNSLGIFPSFKIPVAASGSLPTCSPSLPAFPAGFLPVLPHHPIGFPIAHPRSLLPLDLCSDISSHCAEVWEVRDFQREVNYIFFSEGLTEFFFFLTYISQNHLK